MNVRFLREISDAYRLDKKSDRSTEEIFNEFYEVIKEARSQDMGLYNYLCEMSPVEQQKVFRWYMDLGQPQPISENEEVISEVIAAILHILDPWLSELRGWWSKTAARIATRVEKVAEATARQSKFFRLRHAIVQKNFEECYTRVCTDVKREDLPSDIYSTVRGKHSTGYVTAVGMKQGVCLRNCFIEKVINVIGLFTETHFDCLKASGEFAQYKDADPDDILTVIKASKVGISCREHQKKLAELIADFQTLMEFGYKDDEEDERQEWHRKLRAKVLQARDNVSGAMRPQRQQQRHSRPQQRRFGSR